MRSSTIIQAIRRTSVRTLTTSSTLRTTTLRTFATSASTNTPAASSTSKTAALSVPAQHSVPANANIRSIRKELVRALDADVTELSSASDEGLTQYIKDSKFRIFHNEAENYVLVSRAVGDTLIEARFDLEPDEESADYDEENEEGGEEEEAGQQETKKNEEESEGEGQEEDDVILDRHTIQLIVSKLGGGPNGELLPNTIQVETHVDNRGFLHVDSITSEVQLSNLDPNSIHPLVVVNKEQDAQRSAMDYDMNDSTDKSMLFNELGDATKDHFYRYLESLGIDDQFGQFVQHYAQVVRTQTYMKRMQTLRSFLVQ